MSLSPPLSCLAWNLHVIIPLLDGGGGSWYSPTFDCLTFLSLFKELSIDQQQPQRCSGIWATLCGFRLSQQDERVFALTRVTSPLHSGWEWTWWSTKWPREWANGQTGGEDAPRSMRRFCPSHEERMSSTWGSLTHPSNPQNAKKMETKMWRPEQC